MLKEFKIDDLSQFPKNLEKLLDIHRTKINDITLGDEASYKAVLKPLQELDEELSLAFTPLSNLNSVMNSSETQKAYEESIPLLSKFSSEMAQNSDLFEKIKQIQATNKEEEKVISNEIRDFILSGVNLGTKEKNRMEEISLRLSELSNQFSQNLLDSTNEFELIINDEKDICGLPQSDIDASKIELNGEVAYRFTLQIPSYMAYMTYGPNREYREAISKAYINRAPQNESVINQILSLKHEKANLLGFSNYAQYALETKDAKSQTDVLSFLNTLLETALPQAKEELKELKAYAKKIDDIDDLSSYDVAYYSEKLKREKFDFESSMTKPYFERSRVLEGLLSIISEMFSVTFTSSDTSTWHKSVKVYDIFENAQIAGRIYFDLEAREEKRGGAWMNDWETHYIDGDGDEHLASAFVVCNFSPQIGSNPSLLRHDDVVTLFHEMGHAIHHLFSKCKERSVSGINGVAWDVVEFPSQFLENFAYEASILKQFAFHYETQKPIPDRLLKKIKETKNYQAALGILRQVEFSLFDFELHQNIYQGSEIQALLDSIREKTSLIKVAPYNKFQHGFSHIFAGGYAAGYYSYKWAEVLSADALLSCIDSEAGLSKEALNGYKKHILSNGGKRDMSDLYQQWLGRKADAKSLLKLYGIDIS